MILKKFGQYVNEMMTVAVKKFLINRQNVNMATNAILHSGLTPQMIPMYWVPSYAIYAI